MDQPAILVPAVVLAAAFVVYCYVELARATEVRFLPKWGWAVAVAISVPLGGIVYLLAGRSETGSDA
ncbi:hypothetical protein ET495_04095 [Xylanimonas allomyrinae]|uniref:Cardiolipin synthase N-terminal domain-containing protein n=1 Tax=Xylanimonas allomyrinae TaxID=2509459 RepID=A0A4P6ELI9_9MICO|nr:PLDc N-terminal domain-containing protein [Xylanimonas allomyrinae]QAY62563.1 hypothetical protein ET495_04095 [Xylanimonas allomyrinae]